VKLDISTNAHQILDQVALDQRETLKALTRAINRSAEGLRTDALREITRDYNVTRKAAAPAFSLIRATWAELAAEVKASGSGLRLYGFKPRPSAPGRTKAKGVSIVIKKGVRKTIAGSFIARMPSGHVGVFQRVPGKFMRHVGPRGGRRQAIKELTTLSVPAMVGAKAIQAALEKQLNARFVTALQHEVDYTLSRNG
jgi:hypothetical protein